MAFLRFSISVAIPEDPEGTLILDSDGVGGIRIPTALANQIPAIRQGVRFLKSFSSNINVGQPNEEITTHASLHICHHDTNEACEPIQEM